MLNVKIKEATKVAHQQLEKKVVERLKAIRSEEDYADFLTLFYAYFSGVEQAIAPFITPELLPDYKERRNASYLKQDIQELVSEIGSLPEVRVPNITNKQQAMGALYVMEGSIMGGSIIVKMLEKGGISKGISFFSGYGESTGQKWGVFTAALNEVAKTAEEEELAIEAANETFTRFGEVFNAINVA